MAKRNVEVEFSLIDGVSKGLGTINKGLGSVGSALTSVKGLAVAAASAFGLFKAVDLFAGGVQEAGNFEAALKEVQAVSGATEEQLSKMRAAAIKAAEDSGFSFLEATKGLGELARATGDAETAIAALPSVLALAKAGGLDVAAAAEITTTTLTQFGLAATESGRIADVLAQAANSTTSNVQQLGLSLSYAAPLARQLGLQLEPTVAIIGALADQGFRGERAGTALRNVMGALADPASKFSKALGEAGIKSRDFTTVIGELSKRADKGKSVLLALDSEARPAIIALARDGGKAIAGLTKDLEGAAGTAQKTADIINSGFNASLANLQRSLGKISSEFLDPILAPLATELDSLSEKIQEFAASPAFEELRTNFKDAFLDGIEAVKALIAEFDFAAATKSVQDFVTNAGDNFRELKESVTQVSAAIKATFNSLAAVFNGIQTLTGAAVLGVSRSLEKFYGVLGKVSDSAADISREFKAIADVAEQETGKQAEQLAGNIEALAGNFQDLSGAASDTVAPIAATGEGLDKLGNVIPVVAGAAGSAVAPIVAVGDALKGTVKDADAAATSLGNFGDAAKLASENAAITADISAKSAASFKEVQKGIAEDIAGRKKQASAIREVADASDEAAQAMEDFQAATAQDAGLSDAIFQGLREGFGRVVTDLALLRGVSQDVIRTELNGAIKGSTDSMRGLNEAIKAGDAEIEKLGGSQALAKLRRDAKAAAEAVAQIGPNARAAAADLDAMVRALQDSEAARSGDQASIEKRRFEEELARIAELERVSGGTNRAAADLARQLARKEHEARLAEIAAEGKARVDSELGADAAIAASRAGQSTTGAPAGGGGGLGAAPTTVDNRTIDARMIVNAPLIDERTLAILAKAQKQRLRDSL